MTLHYVPLGQPDNLLSIPLPRRPASRSARKARGSGHGIAKLIQRLLDAGGHFGLGMHWSARGTGRVSADRGYD